ncbi:MAG: tRNA lysidine(34) synthetase TilS [Bacteroidaceae bacterium]|nr:tRNA lysidine(34) synthetase TilS [Bacteroidaceae bacterium]
MQDGLVKQVEGTIRKHHLFQKDSKVLVALSGGADSVALLRILLQLGYCVEALHCNFHLRGAESDRDEYFVRTLCQNLGIQLHIKHFNTRQYCADHKISLEMGARELRYAWFEEVLNDLEALTICVAHHRQDQAETVLFNLIRGTGLRGLAGMHYQNGHITRPLLDCTREDIEEYLNQLQQEWVNDSTNYEHDATRNKIRLEILPLLKSINPQVIKNIARAASHIQEAIPVYERGLLPNHINSKSELHEYVRNCGFNAVQEDNIWQARSGAIIESKTHRLLKHNDQFILQAKDEKIKTPEINMRVIERKQITEFDQDCVYFDNQLVPQPTYVRLMQKGDRFVPFGMKGSKLVSDLLNDLKINRFEREHQYVLCDASDTILWVIGRRASNLYKIQDETKEILVLSQSTKFEILCE